MQAFSGTLARAEKQFHFDCCTEHLENFVSVNLYLSVWLHVHSKQRRNSKSELLAVGTTYF